MKKESNMNDENQDILHLLKCRLLGEETPEGKARLDRWLQEDESHRELLESVRRGDGLQERQELFARVREKEALKRYDRKINYHPNRRLIYWARACAAAIVLAIGIGLLLRDNTPAPTPVATIETMQENTQARLVLASGEEIALTKEDSAREILQHAGVKTVNRGGNLVYADSSRQDTALLYNELSTPKGGEYRVTLADGSNVWLSTSSRLRFPLSFRGDQRVVYLEGEAYFEVARDTTRPFIVRTTGTSVKVYGTEFNVNTREKHQVQTALVNGKIGVTIESTGEERLLSPNQVLTHNRETGQVDVQDTDIYPCIAWKSREFVFFDERLEDVLDELLQWYDAHVFYMNERLKDSRFTGIIPRFEDLGKVLYFISETGTARFNIKGNSITVSDGQQ